MLGLEKFQNNTEAKLSFAYTSGKEKKNTNAYPVKCEKNAKKSKIKIKTEGRGDVFLKVTVLAVHTKEWLEQNEQWDFK